MLKKLNLIATAVNAVLVTTAFSALNTFAQSTTETKPVERIQVTGSKIKRFNLTSPTPVTVISGVEMENQGITNVNDLLAEMPQATVGLSPETTTNTIYASGLNTTDLRGLGSERTLVLVNGRRFVPGSVGDTAVDLNNIPTTMIERIEIATGGAAAVYGADAVAGVVNIITKKSMDGIELDVSTVRPEQSGGEQNNFSITGGMEGDKLSFIASFNYTENKSYGKLSRDFYRNPVNSYANPANKSGSDGIPSRVVLGQPTGLAYYSEGGDFFAKDSLKDNGYDNHHYTFDANGNLKPFDYGLGRIPNPGVGSDASNYFQDNQNQGDGVFGHGYKDYFQTPLERIIASAYGTYELNDDHALTFDFTYSNTEATTESSPSFFRHTIRRDNAFIKNDMAKVMDDNELTEVTLRQANENLWGDRAYNQEREVFRTSIGAEGILNDDWGYSAYAQFGRIEQNTLWTGEVLTQNLANSIDAVEYQGNVVCAKRNENGDVIGAIEGCTPFNTMGATSATQAQLDYIATDATRFAKHDQAVFAVTVDGALFELPAGYVAAAFTAEHRRESAITRPSENMEKGLIFGNSSSPMDGEIDVNELSAEISIPLLEETFLTTDLTLETAFRYMDYSVTGEDNAWKIALNWGVTDELRVRLNRSKSVRAPNLGDLFTPNSKTFSSGRADVCRADSIAESGSKYKDNVIKNCQAAGLPQGWMPSEEWLAGGSLPGYIQGNQDLKNETSNDYTIGVIYTPEFIEGLDLTLDYWSFEIDDAIEYYGRDNVKLCYESTSLDNLFCNNVERDPQTGEITNFYNRPINAATVAIKGIDVESAYRTELFSGDLALKLTATYLIEDNNNSTGRAEDFRSDVGETASPRLKGRFNAVYSQDDSAYVLTMNYRHATVNDNDWTIEDNNYNDIPSYTTFDFMYKTYLMDELQLRVGVNNIFDREPPRNPFTYDDGEFFDVKGRRLSLGAKYTF
ncbi:MULTISPECIES: TonB-dependent receptor [unclassified Pseudoalteromonas]|uniref:TonB-dependent receptor plug domain-containing protein n=1 Tax=unclassified Pseudoalteromonas TaxID=194690 RepID=UPI0025B334C8|nr:MULTISPECIES: TonB-dependent receptor [unclassified Pseudoalteromonas]MDN3378274.1 TonB-dependent receptor [Pseudoalteromonas sp. APC 3893]MDN3386194.1 TonB-dependent receptor [Pseudoalteromonas sp. APC 4017]